MSHTTFCSTYNIFLQVDMLCLMFLPHLLRVQLALFWHPRLALLSLCELEHRKAGNEDVDADFVGGIVAARCCCTYAFC